MIVLLTKQRIPMLKEFFHPSAEPVEIYPLLKKMQNIQMILCIVSIAFGITMLVPGLFTGLITTGSSLPGRFLSYLSPF